MFSDKCDKEISNMESFLEKLTKIVHEKGLDYLRPRLMNIEGQAAASYWSLIKLLLSKDVCFEGRERRGAVDLVNSLLNYGYGVLYSQVYQSIIFAGLNSNISFLHKEQFGKPTLVFDLIEEFRQPVVDKTILGMIRRKEKLTMEGINLTKDSKQKIVKKIFKRLSNKIDFRGKNISLQEIVNYQARSIIKYLEGKENYHPFIDKW
jgi:CRISPR-associated protein Cas1